MIRFLILSLVMGIAGFSCAHTAERTISSTNTCEVGQKADENGECVRTNKAHGPYRHE